MDVAVNQDFTGRPIMKPKSQYGETTPNAYRGFNSVSPYTRDLTQWLNRETGGSERRSGAIDISPAAIDHILMFYAGGLGRFIQKGFDMPRRAVEQDSFDDPRNWPIIDRFVEGKNQWYLNQRYFAMRDAVRTTQRDLAGARTQGDVAWRDRVLKDYGPEVRSIPAFKAAEKVLDKLYKARAVLADAGDKERVKLIEERIREIQARTIRSYVDNVKATKGAE
jgi:hypothetical protein